MIPTRVGVNSAQPVEHPLDVTIMIAAPAAGQIAQRVAHALHLVILLAGQIAQTLEHVLDTAITLAGGVLCQLVQALNHAFRVGVAIRVARIGRLMAWRVPWPVGAALAMAFARLGPLVARRAAGSIGVEIPVSAALIGRIARVRARPLAIFMKIARPAVPGRRCGPSVVPARRPRTASRVSGRRPRRYPVEPHASRQR